MGNCLAQQQKLIRVMKIDGKILEYQPPIKVEQVLSDFPAHAISDTFSGFHHFQSDAKLLPGHLYYLLPLPSTAINKSKEKKVRFLNPEVNDDGKGSPGVVRIKLIITKQELQELIQKQGVTVQDMVSQIHKSDAIGNSGGWKWKPVLESIDEVN
ncbi:hypothetical protein Gotri_011553 [Gossypium trilobum]|uniref:Uncharacterized protein n=1 Tax=Gossypium trilobum TaxID=34281 RepID=A0A7J9EU39_9ROSI|nr:hypothetical protein [Gossypium trilobum]